MPQFFRLSRLLLSMATWADFWPSSLRIPHKLFSRSSFLFSQCCRRANAECKVIQPGLFLVVGSGDSLHRQGKEKSRLSHDVYQRTFALGYWGT